MAGLLWAACPIRAQAQGQNETGARDGPRLEEMSADALLQPLVPPQVLHFMQAPL
jgi:hypothetical protein